MVTRSASIEFRAGPLPMLVNYDYRLKKYLGEVTIGMPFGDGGLGSFIDKLKPTEIGRIYVDLGKSEKHFPICEGGIENYPLNDKTLAEIHRILREQETIKVEGSDHYHDGPVRAVFVIGRTKYQYLDEPREEIVAVYVRHSTSKLMSRKHLGWFEGRCRVPDGLCGAQGSIVEAFATVQCSPEGMETKLHIDNVVGVGSTVDAATFIAAEATIGRNSVLKNVHLGTGVKVGDNVRLISETETPLQFERGTISDGTEILVNMPLNREILGNLARVATES